MKVVFRVRRRVLAVMAGAILAVAVGCDVTVRPFEFAEGDDGGGVEVDATANRPCTGSFDCEGLYVCVNHLCVPPRDDGGGGGDASGAADAGCSPKFEAQPPSVDFGEITQGCRSRMIRVDATNSGCAELIVYEVRLAPENPVFELWSVRTVPFILYPGDQMTLELRFNALAGQGTETTAVELEGPAGIFRIPLRGTTTSESSVLDSFTQGAPEENTFHLSRWPNPATIGVRVGDKLVNPGYPAGWEYDGNGNDVVFGPNAVPPVGKQVKVSYEAECL